MFGMKIICAAAATTATIVAAATTTNIDRLTTCKMLLKKKKKTNINITRTIYIIVERNNATNRATHPQLDGNDKSS